MLNTNICIFFKDIDECKEEIDDCAWNKICLNRIGYYECVCQKGFKNVNGQCIGNLFLIDLA
jgi:hypothetical protein